MKKLVKYAVLLALTVLMCAFMTGCSDGSVVNTKLTLNQDLSGNRVMDVVISENVFNEYFSGSIDDLYSLVTKKCPSELKFTHPADGSMELVFTLEFANADDYAAKCSSLYGEADAILVKPDSIWGTGFSVNENFSSLDLLSWLPDLLVDEGYVPEDKKSKVFSNGTNELIFGDEVYSTGSYIYLAQG